VIFLETAAIQLKNLTKTFGSVVANDHVDLEIRHGEILALLGENGSGKTTLMNMLSGIYYPDGGEIFVDGKEVLIDNPRVAFNYGIGMVHQHFKLVDVLTAAENMVLGLNEKDVSTQRQSAKKCVASVNNTVFTLTRIKKFTICPFLKNRLSKL
jgi:simple sugar transport system ATP-binding protein